MCIRDRHVTLATASPEIDRHTIDVHRSVRDADRHGQAAPADQVRLSPAERSAYGGPDIRRLVGLCSYHRGMKLLRFRRPSLRRRFVRRWPLTPWAGS